MGLSWHKGLWWYIEHLSVVDSIIQYFSSAVWVFWGLTCFFMVQERLGIYCIYCVQCVWGQWKVLSYCVLLLLVADLLYWGHLLIKPSCRSHYTPVNQGQQFWYHYLHHCRTELAIYHVVNKHTPTVLGSGKVNLQFFTTICLVKKWMFIFLAFCSLHMTPVMCKIHC